GSGVRLNRSLSEGESLPGRSISHRKSIVGALWSYLTPRGRGSLEQLTQQLHGGEDTDHGVVGAGPARQDEAWLQAYYNGVTLVVLVVAGYLCWAVYCVLGPFLHPLLWAVLTGLLLHPFKKTWTERISQWLELLENNSIPLSAGLVLSPLFLFNHISKTLETTVLTYWLAMLGSTVATISLWSLYRLSLPLHLYRCLTALHSFLLAFEDALTSYKLSFQLLTVFLAFLLLVVVGRSNMKYFTVLASLSTLVWFLALVNVAAYVLGSALAFPLVIGLFMIGGAVSFAANLKRLLNGGKKSTKSAKLRGRLEEDEEGGEVAKRERREGREVVTLEEVKCSGDLNEAREGEEERNVVGTRVQVSDEEFPPENMRPVFEGPEDEGDVTKSRVSFGSVVRISPERPASEGETGRLQAGVKRSPSLPRDSTSSVENEEGRSQSYYVFLGLYGMFFVVLFWTYPFLFLLLVPFAVWGGLRAAFVSINWRITDSRVWPFAQRIQGWVCMQRALLFPAPLPTLSRLYLSLDRTVLKFAKGSLDSLMSLVIIVGLLVSGVGLTVFLVLQIQVELSHYVAIMAAVWERTLETSPQLAEWIGGGEGGGGGIHETFGSFATQGYMYGREWLAGQVQSALGDTSEKGGAIEKQVLNLYDQLYQSYVLANSTTSSESHFGSGLTNSGDLLNEMQIIVMENLETVVSVLKSMWVVLADNLSLALSLLYSVLGLLLSGGTALINAVGLGAQLSALLQGLTLCIRSCS
ncbi:Transmembrane protein 245, partial [Geodia barretti]